MEAVYPPPVDNLRVDADVNDADAVLPFPAATFPDSNPSLSLIIEAKPHSNEIRAAITVPPFELEKLLRPVTLWFIKLVALKRVEDNAASTASNETMSASAVVILFKRPLIPPPI
jgi:hypothetical protein